MAAVQAIHTMLRAGLARSISLEKLFAVVFAAVIAGASIAHADWEFTHWGMTPEQVVSASSGTARLIAPAARNRDSTIGWEMAADGAMHDWGLTLDGGFMFDTGGGGLICVLYNATGNDVNKLRDGLIARYGRPRKESEFGPVRSLIWQTPDNVELAINQTALTAAVSHCAPGR